MKARIIVILYVYLLTSIGFSMGLFTNRLAEGFPFGLNFNSYKNREIIAKTRLHDVRKFFHLFNITYVICFFAAKGKWPFIPPLMQVKVDQVSRTIFTQNDNFIRNYCRGIFPVTECHRPSEFHAIRQPIPSGPPPQVALPTPTTTINTEVETFDPDLEDEDEDETLATCSCVPRKTTTTTTPVGIVFFDRNHIGNLSGETIQSTIEFLKSFLPPPSTPRPKKKKKTKIRINV